MAALNEYRTRIRLLSRTEVVNERKELFKVINGDAFFPLKSWPDGIRLTFWKKPIGDVGTFKLMLFSIGNGCSPDLIRPWILLSQMWATAATAEKRARQIDFIFNNFEQKKDHYFYYDVHARQLFFLNGSSKSNQNTRNVDISHYYKRIADKKSNGSP